MADQRCAAVVKHPELATKATHTTKESAAPQQQKHIHNYQLLQKRDSGYNSPVTPGTTPENTTPSKAKSLHLGVQQPLRSNSSPATVQLQGETEGEVSTTSSNSSTTTSTTLMQAQVSQSQQNKQPIRKQLSSPGSLDGSNAEQFGRLSMSYPPVNQEAQRVMLGQQQQAQQQQQQQQQHDPIFTSSKSRVLFLAYKCKELNCSEWSDCKHPYCVQVRNSLSHMQTCYVRSSGSCKRCVQFEEQMYRHADECRLESCPVDMCHSIKQQLQVELGLLPYGQQHQHHSNNNLYNNSSNNKNTNHPASGAGYYSYHSGIQRRNSVGTMEHQYLESERSSMLYSFSQFESALLSEDSPASRYIGSRADEIVKKLDSEEPLIPPSSPSSPSSSPPPPPPLPSLPSLGTGTDPPPPPSSITAAPLGGRPGSLRAGAAPNETPLNMLSPIAERSEDMSPSFGSIPHLLGVHSMQSLEPMSSSLDGPGGDSTMTQQQSRGGGGAGPKSAVSMGGPNSLVLKEDTETVFPEQQVLHRFRNDYLSVGNDGHYYQLRDYNASDNLGQGGFGAVRWAKDLATSHLFAIKTNLKDEDSVVDSIDTEARLLSRLGPHVNVIQMYGAVLDCKESQFQPKRMYKLMMELSEHGNLAEMTIDQDTKEPLPLDRDQALFYFWQVLKGVNFLHGNNILHLDIKGSNILVFDEGRTLKLCDFGTAVPVDEVAIAAGKNLGTAHFSAPEILKQQIPHFSSDMWSTMCVLVEMLTGQKPWEHSGGNNLGSLIFLIGNYKNEQMEKGLLPPSPELDPDILDLMRLVFRAEQSERTSALNLLDHPLIVNAYTYEACFDDVLEEVEEEEEEEEDMEDMEEERLCSLQHTLAPTSLSLLPEKLTSGLSLLPEKLVSGYDMKRLSKDSGADVDMDQEPPAYRRMPSSGMNSDSGLDTPYTGRQILGAGKSVFTFNPCPEENSNEIVDTDRDIAIHFLPPLSTPSENFRSLPNPVLQSDPIVQVQRSFSLSLPTTHLSQSSCSTSTSTTPYQQHTPRSFPMYENLPLPQLLQQSQQQQQQLQPQYSCSSSYTRLRHSNSAPVIGDQSRRRRLSLQSLQSYANSENGGRLRRISSEIYVDRGPDIDSPDRVRAALGMPSWVQAVQKDAPAAEVALEWKQQGYVYPSTEGHTHTRAVSEEDDRLSLPHSLPSKRVCHRDDEVRVQEVKVREANGSGQVLRLQDRIGTGGTEVERHVTLQGKTFETYKTVC